MEPKYHLSPNAAATLVGRTVKEAMKWGIMIWRASIKVRCCRTLNRMIANRTNPFKPKLRTFMIAKRTPCVITTAGGTPGIVSGGRQLRVLFMLYTGSYMSTGELYCAKLPIARLPWDCKIHSPIVNCLVTWMLGVAIVLHSQDVVKICENEWNPPMVNM